MFTAQVLPGFGCGVEVGRNWPVLTSFEGMAAAELSRKWSRPKVTEAVIFEVGWKSNLKISLRRAIEPLLIQ